MFYRPADRPPSLRHNPLKAIVSPRPIAWISTLDEQGRANLAPYSFFNALLDAPPMVMFASNGMKPGGERKDSAANARATGEFCVNIVSWALKDAMNVSSGHLPSGCDEFEAAGLEKAPCETIRPPRVAAAPASLECRVWQIVALPGGSGQLVIGEVNGIHLDESFLHDGIFDVTLYQPLARLGYRDYAVIRDLISLDRPG
ncbi:MAG TPA: flavin reductase family protein [Paracoccaceae bacterium]|nr:flavin reductase family protein [Paracoccaceae bacterium]